MTVEQLEEPAVAGAASIVDQVREWFAYNRWANHEMLERAEALTPEQFTRDLGSSFASVRDTIVHLMSAEWLWAERWKGSSPQRRLVPADYPTVASIRALWRSIESEQDAWLARLSEPALHEILAYVNPQGVPWSYPLWQTLFQLVTHAAYHRGQVTTLLRQLGAEPTETDVLTFYDVGAPRIG